LPCCCLQQLGGESREGERQSVLVECFDEMLRRADLSCRSCPEESAQLMMHRRTTVMRHGLESPERVEFGLGLEHALDALGSQRPDQLVFEIGDAGEEAQGFERLVGGDRDARVREGAADVPLVGDVVHAAEVCAWMRAHEVRKRP